MRISLRLAVQTCLILAAFLVFDSSSAFGQGANPFFTPPSFPGSGQAISTDVNGDGKADLLFFDGTVLLGKGDGTFTTATPWRSTASSPGPSANQFAIADFNGDGKQDIFIAGPLNVLSVLFGNGDGTFQAPVTTPINTPATAFLVGDLNGDGKPDVLTQENGGGFVYLGKGDGTFTKITTSALSPAVPNAAFADFNGDGKLDLFVPGNGVQLGNGDGTFQTVLPFPTGALSGSNTFGDFDGDGKLDVFATGGTSTSPEIQVLIGNGDGTFHAVSPQSVPANAGITSSVAVDLNGDGKADIVGSNGSAVQVLISKGDGTFTLGEYVNAPAQAGTGAANMVIADFNGDKKKDVAAFNTMLLANGDGTLKGNATVPGAFGFSAMGDFNGDGHPDFASVGPVQQSATNPNAYEANLNIWLNDGKNNFTLTHTYAIDLPFPNLADLIGLVNFGTAADVNGDGKIDLVGYRADSSGLSMLVLLGNGDGSFGSPIAASVPSVSGDRLLNVAFTLGDVNGDGKPDLLVNAGNGPNLSTLSIFLNTGNGTFGTPSTFFTSGSFGNIAVGDFNNDKKLDLITGTGNGLGVLLGNGDGTFQPTTFITNTACGTACGTPVSADFNGDGNLDLMVTVVNGYQVLLGNGDGTFKVSPAVTVSGESFGGFFQVADFNGDGNADVLGSIGTTNAYLGLILGNGDGTFGSPLPVTNAGFPFVADFNGDNQPDILEVGANQLVFLFNGTGPGFAITAGSGGSATVAAGKTASYALSLGGNGGFSGAVALTCSGAPTGATCEISPSTVTISGNTPQSAMVSITTTAASQLLPSAFSDPVNPARRIVWIFGLLILATSAAASAIVRISRRRFSYSITAAYCALVLVSAALMAGCGGSNANSGSGSGSGTGVATGGTATGTYTITVRATSQSPAVTRTTKLTLIVQ